MTRRKNYPLTEAVAKSNAFAFFWFGRPDFTPAPEQAEEVCRYDFERGWDEATAYHAKAAQS